TDLQICRFLDLHEAYVVIACFQRGRVKHDDGYRSDQSHRAAYAPSYRSVDDVEPYLLTLRQDERGAPQHAPQPGDDRQLGRPADRKVERVAEYDLDDEGDEHDCEHRREKILRAIPQPAGCFNQRWMSHVGLP